MSASRVPLSSMANGTVLQKVSGAFLPAPGASASVYLHDPSSTLWGGVNAPVRATVYSTELGVGTLTQPLSADSNGALPGWVNQGQDLDIVASFAGQTAAPALAEPEIASSAPSRRSPLPATLMGVGDSVTQNGWSGSSPGFAVDGRAFLLWASLLSNGALTLLCPDGGSPAAATGGLTTAQILATEVPLAVAAKPALCTVVSGANDFAGSVPLATTITNFQQIFAALLAAGITPIVCSTPPRVGPPAGLRALNAWLAQYAYQNGLPYADLFGAVVDRTTAGLYLAANTSDGGGHPSQAGAKLMGQAVAQAAAPFIPAKSVPLAPNNTVVASDTVDRVAVATNNSLHLVDTNADGTPDGYNVPSSGTCDLATAADIGKYATLTRAAADIGLRMSTALTGMNDGDQMLLAAKLYTTVKALGGNAGFWLDLTDGSKSFAGFNDVTEDIPAGSVFSQRFTYHTGTAGPRIEIFANGVANAKIGVVQPTLLNLTQAGIA